MVQTEVFRAERKRVLRAAGTTWASFTFLVTLIFIAFIVTPSSPEEPLLWIIFSLGAAVLLVDAVMLISRRWRLEGVGVLLGFLVSCFTLSVMASMFFSALPPS